MKLKTSLLPLLLAVSISILSTVNSYAAGTAPAPNALTSANAGATGGGGGDTVTPDMFSGTMSYNVPIEVPPGRNGMTPQLNLLYRSGNPNGYMGVGWELEPGAIVRSLKGGINYNGNDYAIRMAGATIDLIKVASTSAYDEYQVKIESSFNRIRYIKAVGTASAYWEVTDKSGMKYIYGKTVIETPFYANSVIGTPLVTSFIFNAISRQDDPANANNIFKWCLERVEDPSGNYVTYSYIKDQGQIYLDRVDYTGHISGLAPTNYVKFYWETRTDAPDMYTTNFKVKTAKRLKTIDVLAGASGTRVKIYSLQYDADPYTAGSQYSISTSRSLLTNIKLYASDAIIDASSGVVTGGSSLPQTIFAYSGGGTGFSATPTSMYVNTGGGGWNLQGDFDGDGKTDILTILSATSGKINYPNGGNGFSVASLTGTSFNTGGTGWNLVGDFDGDGKDDVLTLVTATTGYIHYAKNGFSPLPAASISINTGDSGVWNRVGDFNGDGKADVLTMLTATTGYINESTGNGFVARQYSNANINTGGGGWNMTGDFNGDGKTDVLTFITTTTGYLNYASGNGFNSVPVSGININTSDGCVWNRVGDFNGDGKADVLSISTATTGYMNLSIGNGFSSFPYSGANMKINPTSGGGTFLETVNYMLTGGGGNLVGDFNGDGKTDILSLITATTGYLHSYSAESGLITIPVSGLNIDTSGSGEWRNMAGDFNGDGKMDVLTISTATTGYMNASLGSTTPDLLTSISNGIGATTTIAYTPSTQYQNTLLPFPVQTVSSVTTNDGNGNISTTSYSYAGGYFQMAEKDFRGFNYVKTTGPVGPNGEQTVSETWFHQGNYTGIIDATHPDDISATVGYMKGKPYRSVISDGAGNKLSESFITYATDTNGAPYFTPPTQVDNTIYVNGIASKTTRVVSTYDNYGNVTQVDNYGDTADTTDDTTAVTSYGYNAANWMMSYPASSAMYAGIGTASMTARTDYYYDMATSCASTSTNQVPIIGKLTRTVAWLNGGVSPEVHMAYDSYGNRSCVQDALGNVSTVSYDPTFTFPLTATNALNQTITTTYYGVNGVVTDKGLYGQTKSVTGLNADTTTTEYDVFGRKTKEILPDNSWSSIGYNNFGLGIMRGSSSVPKGQHIYTTNSAGLSSWAFFDGMGRPIVEKSTGPDNKLIAKKTIYNSRGAVRQVSLPYFDMIDAPVFSTSTYDALGRVIQIDMPDGTNTKSCYSGWVSATVDANGHKRKETKNAAGKLIQVDEYSGTYTTCGIASGTVYATTTYQYDTAGNLLSVTDAKGNVTSMSYDTLMRKVSMHDPDMGNWSYSYDPNGNLVSQTDAKGQMTYSQYDTLNRIKQKDYLTQKPLGSASADIQYIYDNASASNGIGRLTMITASSGDSTSYNYNILGKTIQATQVVSGTPYTTQSTYDVAGRQKDVTYPDNSVITHTYNGPFLQQVSDASTGQAYVSYTGYNALGQMSTASYSNGVVTNYTYWSTNKRLSSINTLKGASTYQSLNYLYDNVGNITNIADTINGNQSYVYDHLDRLISASGSYGTLSYAYDQIGNMTLNSQLGSYTYNPSGPTSVQPHAVTAAGPNTYTYDLNGNMQTGAGRTFTYDVENKPITITNGSSTVNMYYDASGNRVKKVSGVNTTIYIGGMYECTNGNCEKYIFANGNRIAKVTVASTTVNYYHADHLGSSSIITDGAGNQVEQTAYYPYGATRTDAGTVNVRHKFTGQEYDAETGLYFYGARYYDPVLCRFISPDTIVPNPYNPQNLNRYSYCLNNPLRYTDPSGHFIVELFWSIVISGLEYLSKLYNHNQDPAHYPAPSGFSIGMTYNYGGGTVSVDVDINGIPIYSGSPYSLGITKQEDLNGVAKSDWETPVVIASLAMRTPGVGVALLMSKLATKGPEMIAKAAEYGSKIISNERGATLTGKTTDKLYHYTSAEPDLILKEGLIKGKSGNVYTTSADNLTPLQAQIDLALKPNYGLPQHLYEIDVNTLRYMGYNIPDPQLVTRMYNMPGGGIEFVFSHDIPAQALKVIR